MKNLYIVEFITRKKYRVSVQADTEENAVENILNSFGHILSEHELKPQIESIQKDKQNND